MNKVIAILALMCAALLLYRTFVSIAVYSQLTSRKEKPIFSMLSLPGYLWIAHRKRVQDDSYLRKALRRLVVADISMIVAASAIVLFFKVIE